MEPRDSVVLKADRYQVTSVEPIPPTWRDVWAIVRGRYRPKVRQVTRLTLAGFNRQLKKTWTRDALVHDLNRSPLLTFGDPDAE